MECYSCHKFEHFSRDYRQNKKKPKRRFRASAAEAEEEEDEEPKKKKKTKTNKDKESKKKVLLDFCSHWFFHRLFHCLVGGQ